MRVLMFGDGGGRRLGALVDGDGVVDLGALAAARAVELPPDVLGLIDLGDEGLARVRELLGRGDVSRFRRPLSDVHLLAPLDPPREDIMAIGRNYGKHAQEIAAARGEEVGNPTVFSKAQTTVSGPHDPVPVDRSLTQQVDWEAELGVVIGRRGKDIPEARALEHVWGYLALNDVSARDIQYGWGGQFFKGKSLDGFCPIGPWIVTADEVPNPQALRVRCRVNGVEKQNGFTGDMIFPVARLIAELSRGMTLLPGNLIATGTPDGVGHGRTPPEFLQAGDVVETEIEGIGTLRNEVVEA